MNIEQIDTLELVRSIRLNYERDVMTIKELMEIMCKCEFSKVEARRIIRKAFKDRNIGRVSYRQIRRNFIGGSSLIVLRQKVEEKEII